MHLAVNRANPEMVEFHLEKGAYVNATDDEGNTALHIIRTQHGHPSLPEDWAEKIIKLLLANGADVNARDKQGRTPLHILALEGGYADIVKMYVSEGAEVNAVDDNGFTSLDITVDREEQDMVQGLIDALREHGGWLANPDRVSMLKAASRGDAVQLWKLVRGGVRITVTDIYGNTPLHLAARNGQVLVVKFLIAKGAKLNAKDNEGRTPLDLAETEEMRELLRGYGAKPGE